MRKKILLQFLIFFCLNIFFSLPSFSQTFNPNYLRNFALMHDLADDWQVYDNKYDAYVPYTKERHQNPKSMSFWLDMAQYQPYQLIFWAEANTFLFINNQLYWQIDRPGWQKLKLDSLAKQIGKPQVFVTFYDPQLRLPLKAIVIAHQLKASDAIIKKIAQTSTPLNRQLRLPDYKDFVIIIAVLLAIIYTFLWNYNPKTFLEFYNLKITFSTLALSRRDLSGISRPFAGIKGFFLFAHALVVAFYYFLGQIVNSPNLDFQWIGFSWTNISLIINYLALSLLVFALIFGKYVLINFSGLVLNMRSETTAMHFYEYIRLGMTFYGIFSLAPLIVYISMPYFSQDFYQVGIFIILIFHIFQSILVSFFVFQQSEFRSLYLFYYLCITELIPILTGIKFLI
jgi:hypothetical protein